MGSDFVAGRRAPLSRCGACLVIEGTTLHTPTAPLDGYLHL